MQHRKHLLQIILALSLLGSAFFPREKENKEALWNATKLSYSTLAEQSNTCQNSPQHELACKNAVRTLLQYAGAISQLASIHDYGAALKKIPQNYFQGKVPASTTAAAWNSFLQSFDPYGSLFPASWGEAQASRSEDNFTGIGIYLRNYEDSYRISAITPESPAENAGIKAGDLLYKIKGKEATALSREQIAQLLEGPHGDRLHLELIRNGQKISAEVARKNIRIPLLRSKILPNEKTGERVGYISLHSLNKKGICEDVRNTILTLEKAQVNALVLDLRGNPGGFVNEALCISSLFLGEGKLLAKFQKIEKPFPLLALQKRVSQEKEDENFQLYTQEKQLTKLPLLVAIDGASASAAEIIASALRDNHRALLFGEKSYGKGIMQSMYKPWGREDLVLAKSTHEIFRPNGASLQKIGVNPDIPASTL